MACKVAAASAAVDAASLPGFEGAGWHRYVVQIILRPLATQLVLQSHRTSVGPTVMESQQRYKGTVWW